MNLTKMRIHNALDKRKELLSRQGTLINYQGDYGGGVSKITPRIDKLIRHKPDLAEAYDDIMTDGHLKGLITSRKSGVLSLEYQIDFEKADKSSVEKVREVFQQFNLYHIIDSILDARLYGMQPIELTWDNYQNGLFVPIEITPRPFQWFAFDIDGNLRFMSENSGDDGEECHPDKYLLPRSEASYINPYGVGLLALCYWNIYFKKNGTDYWAEFVEKYGAPWTIGTIIGNVEDYEEEEAKAEEQLINLHSSNTLVKNDKLDVDINSPNVKSSSDTFKEFIEFQKNENSIIFLGHEAAASSTPGKLGNENQSIAVSERIIQQDKRLVTDTINNLIYKIYKHNYPNQTELPSFSFYEEESLNTERAERDAKIWSMGFGFSPDYIEREYNFKKGDVYLRETNEVSDKPDPEKKRAEQNMSNIFSYSASKILAKQTAEKNEDLIEDTKEYIVELDDTADAMDNLTAPIFSEVKKASSLKKLEDNYYKLYSKLKDKNFKEDMEIALFIFDVIGWHSAAVEEDAKTKENNSIHTRFFNSEDYEITFKDIKKALKKTPKDALKYFKKKGVKLADNAEERIKAIQKHAFTVTGVTKLDVLKTYKNLITGAIADGKTLRDFKKEFEEQFKKKGWNRYEEDGETIRPKRLDIVYQTNLASAYTESRWDKYDDTTDLIPYVELDSTLDKGTTVPCKYLNGKIFRKDDKTFRKKLRSKGHYGCRRLEVSLTTEEVKGKKIYKGSEINKKYYNDKEFYHTGGEFKPDLSKYDKELAKEYEKEQ